MRQVIATKNAPEAIGPYVQANILNGVLYASGQLPIDATTGTMPDSIEEQTRQALDNLGAILKDAGMHYADIVKTTVLLADINDFAAMNKVYETYFPTLKPARVCYAVKALPKGAKVEIDCIAGK